MSEYRAKVTLTVEVTDVGSWSPGCSIDQIEEQATRAAVGRLNKLCQDNNVRVIGKPSVETIIIRGPRS